MNMLFRLLAATPKTMTLPVIAILAGWYGGAKYGAPEFVMDSIDNMLEQAGGTIGGMLSGDKNEEDAAPANGGTEV